LYQIDWVECAIDFLIPKIVSSNLIQINIFLLCEIRCILKFEIFWIFKMKVVKRQNESDQRFEKNGIRWKWPVKKEEHHVKCLMKKNYKAYF